VLKENPYSERALCSRIDALVELGRYAEASKAADLADARKPGVPVFTRYAYVHELRGDVTTARRVLEQALAAATSPGDISYVAGTLGQLAWNQGDYKTALNDYGRALAADENYLPALEGRARTQAALGDRADAIKGMELVVSRYPLPQPLVELGELYESRGAEGDKAKADDQYALVDAWIALARANGVNADLDTALAAADHGDVKSALRPPAPSGPAATPCTPRTPSPGPCTSTASTRRPSPTPARPRPPATTTPRSSTTSA
jgi:tetratricopeptide (TPR) repeat protein